MLLTISRPDLVTYQRVIGADHAQEWNVDPQAYEDALKTFLTWVSEPEAQPMDKIVDSL